ncbi:MAG TPA: hypothetical protein VHS06_00795 [Chloroflexota bacterium]|nr:hypothetical protein [Chloroflexota bacterium]
MELQAIHEQYSPRIQALLEGLASALRHAGYTVAGPDDSSGYEDFVWRMLVTTGERQEPQDDDIDVHFWICDSESWAGDNGGISVLLDLVTFGGRLVGQFCPMNYTPKVWVPREDPDAIEERFVSMEHLDIDSTVALVQEYLPLAA